MSVVSPPRPVDTRDAVGRARTMLGATWVLAAGIVVACAYGLMAADPYRGVPHATVVSARAQDVCSLVVVVLLLGLSRRRSASAYLVRLGLLAYVAYSYAFYLIGIPMNRVFLVYVVIECLSGAALLDGLVRLRPDGWPRVQSRRLERGTGQMLVVVAALFAGLWFSALVPYAVGGATPSPAGPGGAAYPVFVLDLVVVLPCIATVGVLLLKGRAVAGPLAVVTLVKIVTLFTALWAGVVVGVIDGADVHLGADAGPSLLMLAASVALIVLWLRRLSPAVTGFSRSTVWGPDPSPTPTRRAP